MVRQIVASEATGPYKPGSARKSAASEQASPPNASDVARSRITLPDRARPGAYATAATPHEVPHPTPPRAPCASPAPRPRARRPAPPPHRLEPTDTHRYAYSPGKCPSNCRISAVASDILAGQGALPAPRRPDAYEISGLLHMRVVQALTTQNRAPLPRRRGRVVLRDHGRLERRREAAPRRPIRPIRLTHRHRSICSLALPTTTQPDTPAVSLHLDRQG